MSTYKYGLISLSKMIFINLFMTTISFDFNHPLLKKAAGLDIILKRIETELHKRSREVINSMRHKCDINWSKSYDSCIDTLIGNQCFNNFIFNLGIVSTLTKSKIPIYEDYNFLIGVLGAEIPIKESSELGIYKNTLETFRECNKFDFSECQLNTFRENNCEIVANDITVQKRSYKKRDNILSYDNPIDAYIAKYFHNYWWIFLIGACCLIRYIIYLRETTKSSERWNPKKKRKK